nr:HNH endonuclease [Qipengyuania pacifica]
MLCDDEDFERLNAHSWYAHNCSNPSGNHKRPARRESTGRRKVIFAHHEILGRPPKGMVVDHINGDPWDNRKVNLRFATFGQNVRNQRRERKEWGGGKGVHLISGHIVVKIMVRGSLHTFYGFDTIREADLAYDALALHLHGEFASLNHPDIPTAAISPEALRVKLEGKKPSARVLRFLKLGHNAVDAAKLADCSASTAAKVARKHGIKLSRGRPRKVKEAA